MGLKLFCAALAVFMLGYVGLVFLTFHKDLGDLIVGIIAGSMVAACAVAIHIYQKKGEVS